MLEVFFSRNIFTARRFLKKAKALMMKHDPTVTDHLGGLFPSQAQTACCSRESVRISRSSVYSRRICR